MKVENVGKKNVKYISIQTIKSLEKRKDEQNFIKKPK